MWMTHLLRRDRAITALAIGAVFAVAAGYTLLGIGMPMSAIEMTMMSGMTDGNPAMAAMMQPMWSVGYAALVFLMWWIMMIAMMMPSAAPTVLLFAALTRKANPTDAANRRGPIFLAGYLAVWAGFGLIATAAQWALEIRGLVSPDMMNLTSALLGGMLLVGAGLYQLTPLKQGCLEHCRSPMQFLVERRRSGTFGAFRMGVEHGAFCLGCCWFLMALLFVGGIMNLYWIVALAAFVAVEKLAPMGGLLSRTSGLVLVSAGVWFVWHGVG